MATQQLDEIQLILEAGRRLGDVLDSKLSKLGGLDLTYSRYRVLDYIIRQPQCSRIDIACALGRTQGADSEWIQRLVDQGYLTETTEQYQRRKKFLAVAHKCVDLIAEARDIVAVERERLQRSIPVAAIEALEHFVEHGLVDA